MSSAKMPSTKVLTDATYTVRKIVVDCTYCEHRHRHQAPLKATGSIIRVSHCKHDRRPYLIVWDDEVLS